MDKYADNPFNEGPMATTTLTTDVIGTNQTYTFSTTGDTFVLAAGTRFVADGYSYIYGTTTGINVTIDGYLWLQGDSGVFGAPFYFGGGDRITIGADAQMVLTSSTGTDGLGQPYCGIMLGQNGIGGTDFANHGDITLLGGNGFVATGGTNVIRNYGTIDVTNGAFTFDGPGGDQLRNAGTITGKALNVVFTGGGSDSVVNTGHIDGNLVFGAGADTYRGIGGTIAGTITGGGGSDTYFTSQSVMNILELGGGGTDTVYATVNFRLAANLERLYLQGFAETGIGNASGNIMAGNGGDNRLFGLGGLDSIAGFEGDDVISGGDGNDTLRGGDGDDWLRGAVGNDSLSGAADNDTVTGGLGADSMAGGTGNDRFVFVRQADGGKTVATSDLITDFTRGQDVIDLFGIDARTTNAAPNDAFTFIGAAAFTNVAGQMRYSSAAGVTTLLMDVNGNGTADMAIRLTGTLALTAQDFIL
jgi:Ca2+-binding RTX toxin-like protein